MAEWADPKKIKRTGDEPAPIVMPIFIPTQAPVHAPTPEKVAVPVRR